MSEPTLRVRVSEWPLDGTPIYVALEQTVASAHPCWVEIVSSLQKTATEEEASPEYAVATADAIIAACEEFVPQLRDFPEVLEFVLFHNGHLRKRRYGDKGDIRLLTSVAVTAPPVQSGAWPDMTLLFDPVELVASERCLISCRHESQTDNPEMKKRRKHVGMRLDHSLVEQRAADARPSTGGDVAVLVLREHALLWEYPLRTLREWQRDWESELFQRAHVIDTADEAQDLIISLSHLAKQANTFSRTVERLNVPRQEAALEWFAYVRDESRAFATSDLIAEATRRLNNLGGDIRSCFTLFQSYSTVAQLREVERQRKATEQARDNSEKVQKTVELIVFALAVPALAAAVYGANVKLPGSNKWSGTVILAAVMVISGLLGFLVALLLRRHRTKVPSVGDTTLPEPYREVDPKII